MSEIGIKWTNFTQHVSKLEALKQAKGAEDAALRAGARALKKEVKKEVIKTIPGATHKGKWKDTLVDAVRQSKPYRDRAAISVYLAVSHRSVNSSDSTSGKSGAFRLRFFESSKERYVKSYRGVKLKTPRKAGNLSKFNGFFDRGVTNGQSKIDPAMRQAFEKYINRLWTNG